MDISTRLWPTSTLLENLSQCPQLILNTLSTGVHKAIIGNNSGEVQLRIYEHPQMQLGLLWLKGHLNEGFSLNLAIDKNMLASIYSIEGQNSTNGQNSRTALDNFKGHLISKSAGDKLSLEFPAAISFSLAVLFITQNGLTRLSSRASTATSDLDALNTIGPEGIKLKYHLGFLDILTELEKTEYQGLAQTAFTQAQLSLVLANQLYQFKTNVAKSEAESTLSKRDLEVIMRAIRIIKNELGQNVKVQDLTERLGTNENKLQEGFRLVTGQTVKQFILEQRLERSKELLLNSDFSVSEIVYRIGLTNRGYFSKIFKERYNFSPRTYRKSQAVNRQPSG